jgi:putative membrane protein
VHAVPGVVYTTGEEERAMDFIVHILLNAVLLFLVGQLVDGIEVRDGKSAIFGAIVLGVANASVRKLIVLLTLPITFLTLGLFVIVINALMLMIAAAFVDGFEIKGFSSAVWGSLAFSVLNFLVGMFLGG